MMTKKISIKLNNPVISNTNINIKGKGEIDRKQLKMREDRKYYLN